MHFFFELIGVLACLSMTFLLLGWAFATFMDWIDPKGAEYIARR